MNSILLRANGTKKLGMGHLARIALIANYINKKLHFSPILLINDDNTATNFLKQKVEGCEIIVLKNEKESTEREVSQIQKIILEKKVKLIITDLLEDKLTSNYLKEIKKLNLPICTIIDDSNYKELDVELVLNGNPNQTGYSYQSTSTKYLTGPRFFLMDERYAQSSYQPRAKEETAFVTLGGSDHNNLLFKVLKSISAIDKIKKVIIATSQSTGYVEELQQFLKNYPKDVQLEIDLNGFVDIWNQCSFAITAGGNTLFERIAYGVPGITLCQLTRQMEIADKFQELGLNINLGLGTKLTQDEISAGVARFLDDKSIQKSQMIDCKTAEIGNGLCIFYEEVYNLINKE